MAMELGRVVRRTAVGISLLTGSYALAACGGDSLPAEVEALRTPEKSDEAREHVLAEQDAALERDGLLGYHKLQLVRPIREESTETNASGEFESESDGLFILVAGGSSGEAEGEYESNTSTRVDRFVRLAWQVNNDARDTIVSDFPVEQIIVRDATEDSGVSLEFAFNQETLIDFDGSVDRDECVIVEEHEQEDDERHLVPAKEGCLQPLDHEYPDDYIRNAPAGFIERIYLYLDEESRNQYFTAIGQI